MDVRKLPETKTKNGCYYKLVKRTEHVALYEQRYNPVGRIIGYEVFLIKIIPEHPNPFKGTIFPAHEKFPGNEDFGATAWAWNTREAAEKKFKELEERSADPLFSSFEGI
jgi:hypothetical protein